MNLFTKNSPYIYLLKYLLFLPKHPVESYAIPVLFLPDYETGDNGKVFRYFVGFQAGSVEDEKEKYKILSFVEKEREVVSGGAIEVSNMAAQKDVIKLETVCNRANVRDWLYVKKVNADRTFNYFMQSKLYISRLLTH